MLLTWWKMNPGCLDDVILDDDLDQNRLPKILLVRFGSLDAGGGLRPDLWERASRDLLALVGS